MFRLKNMSIALKLWLIILPAIIALIGLLCFFIYRSNEIYNDLEKLLYEEVYINSSHIFNAERGFYQAEITEEEIYLSDMSGTKRQTRIDSFNEDVQKAQEEIITAMKNLKINNTLFNEYKHYKSGLTLNDLFNDFGTNYAQWQSSYDLENLKGNMSEHTAYLEAARNDVTLMGELLNGYTNSEIAKITNSIHKSIRMTIIIIVSVIALVFVLAVVIIRYFRTNIQYITNVNQKIAGGELSLQIEEKRMSRDEIGRLCTATGQILNQLNVYVAYIQEMTQEITKMAGGDLRIQLQQDYTGQFRPVKDAFERFADEMDATMKRIRSIAELVKDGACSISSGAQNLSQGSAEQAGTVEELTASLEEISSQTSLNAENAEKADTLSIRAKANASKGTEQMKEMLEAMDSINVSSANIYKIIKVIEDIAFQTNILALNAAVEAARAGQHGKGFAVVAEEVRTLAARSSKAANETTEMIEDSIRNIEAGTKIAKDTADALEMIVDGVENVANLVGSIAAASKEQALGIEQINQGIMEVSQVVQTNAATSEENAAVSEELSKQADLLYTHVAGFTLKDHEAND